MSERADKHAAAKRDEDLGYLSTYISTEAGATGQSNADVLGRLVTDAHARIVELESTLDAIKHSLENVVAPKLHELRQLPEKVDEQGVKISGLAGVIAAQMSRIAIIEDDLQGGNLPRLPEGVTRDLG